MQPSYHLRTVGRVIFYRRTTCLSSSASTITVFSYCYSKKTIRMPEVCLFLEVYFCFLWYFLVNTPLCVITLPPSHLVATRACSEIVKKYKCTCYFDQFVVFLKTHIKNGSLLNIRQNDIFEYLCNTSSCIKLS